MKFKLLLLIVLLSSFFLPKITHAESIPTFNSQIHINKDSSLNVSETIIYDFGNTAHHGIYRDIPYQYQARGGNYDLDISVNGVTDERGNPYRYTLSRSSGQLEIKIGDPNATITGLHTYILKYTVKGAINYFNSHDELYWNVTGNSWTIPIGQTLEQVFLPSNAPVNQIEKQCFAGEVGSDAPCNVIASGLPGATATDQVNFNQRELGPSQGLTVVVGFPKGLVQQPTAWQNFLNTLQNNWSLAIPLFVLLGMWFVWLKKGRDPLGFKTIIPQYEPPQGLSPIEVGTIIDEVVNNKDITAEVINLAVKGFIKITQLEEKHFLLNTVDYQLDLLQAADSSLNAFEQALLQDIFGDKKNLKISELNNKFSSNIIALQQMAYDSVVSKGYFSKNPSKVKNYYFISGLVIVIFSISLGAGMFSLFTKLALVLSGLIIMIFSRIMPKRTIAGAQAKEYILGLKQYLSVAEKDRLKFFDAPDQAPQRFEKLLPYAMVLGVEKEWAEQFAGIYTTSPTWYYNSSGQAFSTLYFVNNMSNFAVSSGTAFTSAPHGGSGLGGGGFSGGGFGGGGGGSW